MTKLTYTRDEVEELMKLEAKFERERIIALWKQSIKEHQERGIEAVPFLSLIALIEGQN
jgi:hypothetical protein